MKACGLTCLLTFWLCFSVKAFADDTAYVIARDFAADGKVLELNVPREVDGVRFFFVFQNANSDPHVEFAVAREGIHCYETRYLPDWNGPMKLVGVSLRDVTGRVKEPTLADNIDMFFEPDRITPSTINLLSEHRVAGYSWTATLLLVFAAGAIFFRTYRKQSLPVALVVSFVVAWAVMDLRIVIDHADTVYKQETLHRGMPSFDDAGLFADQAGDMIDGQTWSLGSVQVGANLVKYRLAEHPYAPPGSVLSPSVLITGEPSGQVLLHYREYYLVKRTP